MGTWHELRHVLGAVPAAFRKSGELPDDDRLQRLRGVPLHLVELVALAALRFREFVDGGEGPRVLLLHGYAGHPRSHGLLRRHLRSEGFSPESVDMRGNESVQAMSDVLCDWLLENVDADSPIPVVAHSLGGVVARFAMRDDGVRKRIARLITLGSPHEGTRIAELVESEKANQMERDAELTAVLERQEPWGQSGLPPLLCLWSRTDLMMVPPESAIADGAESRELAGITHYGYMLRPSAWQAVADALRQD